MPVDSLRFFRVAFGLLMAFAVARFFAHGWISEYYREPTVFFPYPGLEWIRPWPGSWMYAHFAVMGISALGIAQGRWLRTSAVVFFCTFTWAHLIDRTNYLNHYHLVSMLALLLVVLPIGQGEQQAPRWALWAVRAQLGLVYFFGGVAKLQPDWLLNAEPLSTWLHRNQDFPVIGAYFSERWLAFAMSWTGAMFDLSVVALLSWRRTRPWAYAAVLLFHLVTARLFNLGMFPWIMIFLTPVFFAPDWPRRAWAWLVGVAHFSEELRPPVRQRLWTVALVVFIGAQAMMSLRAFAAPGDTRWNEDGFRFSWRVMVMEKNGAVEMVARDPDDGRTWRILPSELLTPLQARMVSTQPDMLLSFARIVDASLRARGVRDPEVRADVMVSLNGRAAARLVDPTVDLSREEDTRGWVLEMPR